MFKQKRLTVLSMAVVLALLAAAVMPFTALADDVAPPPTEVPVVDVPPTEVPVVDAAPTEEPVVEVAPTDVPVVDVPPTESVSDVVAAMAEANAVLLDADGNPIPMASQEAAEALTALDPYVVRAGVTNRFLTDCTGQPVDATNTCTVSATPIQAAIDFAIAGETINVEAGTYNENIIIAKQLVLTGLGSGATTTSFTLNNGASVTGSSNIFAPLVNVNAGAKIQDGILLASSGGTVNVAAGTYNEAVTINKSVTLRGANAGIHPAVGAQTTEAVGVRGPETILSNNYPAIVPAADNITVDGFKFTGAGGRIIDTYSDANNFHLTNSIFNDPVIGTTQGVIQFGGGSHTNMVVDFNLFQDKGDHTLYFGGGPYDGLRVANNRFNVENDSMFWAATPLVNGVIENNEFDGTIGGSPGEGFGTINIGQGGNIAIRNNWFHDEQYTSFQVGIIGGSVTDNVFERMYPLSGGPFADAFQLWGGEWGTSVSTDVTIQNNTIHYNDIPGASYPTHGIRLRAPETGTGIDASTIYIHYNQFINGAARSDAFAIRHQGNAATTADAEKNWWGTAQGPSGGAFSGNVDFSPWYATDTTMPSTEYVSVDHPGNSIIALSDTIQGGVDAASGGDTVNVAAGTYNEGSLAVNKAITLQGAGSDSDLLANTVISGSGSGIGLSLSAGSDASHRVTVKDVRVTGFQTGVVVNSYNTLNNVASVSNTLYGVNLSPLQDLIITGSKFNNNNTGLKIASTASVDNLTITNSEFNANTNIGWYSDKGSGSGSNITNLNISYTTFNDNLNKGFYTEKLSNAVFDHITINNSGTGGALNHRAGMDLNLKYGDYTNIQILNSTISNSGTGDPNGGGLLIKARSTGSYASLPATLNNVTLSNLTVTGNGGGIYAAGIRIGESNNSFTGIDAGPTGVVISNSVFSGNTAHAVRNATAATIVLAENNFWNSASGPSGVGLGSGDAVSNGVDYTPWLTVPVGQTDTDGDGIQDATDNCSTVANANQANTDGDGLGNACDPTPNGDTDGDGVDNCPTVANADQVDFDSDGLGNACDLTPNGDPTPNDGTTTGGGTTLSPLLIPVTGGEQVTLNTTTPTTLQLPSGNQVSIDSGVGTTASVSAENETSLPATVPSGNTFVSAMAVNVMNGGTTVSTLPAGTTMEVSFVIPSSFAAGQTFSILYWNPALNGGLGDWETVPATVTSDGHVVATVNFTGTFVLVTP